MKHQFIRTAFVFEVPMILTPSGQAIYCRDCTTYIHEFVTANVTRFEVGDPCHDDEALHCTRCTVDLTAHVFEVGESVTIGTATYEGRVYPRLNGRTAKVLRAHTSTVTVEVDGATGDEDRSGAWLLDPSCLTLSAASA